MHNTNPSENKFSSFGNKLFFGITLFLFLVQSLFSKVQAQNCTTLYMIDGERGIVYSVNTANGALTQVADYADGQGNLAVGPNPTNLLQTVYTTTSINAGATVFRNNVSTGETVATALLGISANPTNGTVYGISSTKRLIRVTSGPSDLGVLTGDATFTAGTVAPDGFFDSTENLYVVVTNGAADYIYKINTTTLVATQYVQLSGTLPTTFRGMALIGTDVYVLDAVNGTEGCGFFNNQAFINVVLYKFNLNNGVSTQVGTNRLRTETCGTITMTGSAVATQLNMLDLASCATFTPTPAPTCNELFGSVNAANLPLNGYRINLTDMSTTLVATTGVTSVGATPQGNFAFGPSPGNLNQNRFVASPNGASGNIYAGNAIAAATTMATLVPNRTWGSPIGIGTDPSTGIVYGINARALTRWTGDGVNGAVVGTITGDTEWSSATAVILNDVAVDNAANVYAIVSNSANANVYLYRINTTTLVASKVVQLNGTVPNLGTANGNGLAYLGDYFYFSRINTVSNTDIWRLNAMTGLSEFVGQVTGTGVAGVATNRGFGDLASCATVTNVPGTFTYDCGNTSGGLQNGIVLVANGSTQTGLLRVPITNAVNGLVDISIAGAGFTVSPSPYRIFVAQGATFIDLPITFDGSAPAGTRQITVTSPQSTGSCLIPLFVDSDTDGDGIGDLIDVDDDNDGVYDCDERGLPSTADVSNLFELNGTAVKIGTKEVQLTSATNSQAGQMWSYSKVDFAKNFFFSFEANLGTNDGGADGIAIVFHNDPLGINAVGSTGIGIGARGIVNGLVLELDTFDNGTGAAVGDIAADHGMIWDTDMQSGAGLLTTAIALPNLENGVWKKVLVNWNASTKTLSYTVDGTLAGSLTNTNFTTAYFGGADKVFFGYTSSTGGFNNDQRVRYTDFCTELPITVDTDNDGIPNQLDLDSDGDGCSDSNEYYNNNTSAASGQQFGQTGGAIAPVNANGQVTLAAATYTGSYTNVINSGVATACVDYDGDGVSDSTDLDDDNDGILDTNEKGACGPVLL